jgi:SHS2 domain-containing protein
MQAGAGAHDVASMTIPEPLADGWYRFVEHVAEIELHLEASTEAGLFTAALAAFHELVDGDDPEGEPLAHEIVLTADEHALLLVDWIGELTFLAEVEGLVPERVSGIELEHGRLKATVEGRRGRPRHLVKAATLSNLALERHDGAWRSRLVLDV